MNAYGFAGGDRINFSDPMGLWPCPELCAAGAGAGSVAVGGGTLAGIGVGTIAAAAAPIAVGVGIGLWASQPVNPAAARMVPGALAGSDATAVALPTSMEMGKLGNKIRSILTGIAIGLGDGMEEEQKKVKENRQREEQIQEEKTKPRPGGKGKPDGA